MRQQIAKLLVGFSVLNIVLGCTLGLTFGSGYGRLLVLDGAVLLGLVLLWHGGHLSYAILIGMLVGAAIPMAWGNYTAAQNIAYANSHPGEYVCGTCSLGSVFSILIAAPIFGIIGAAAVSTSSALYRAISPPTPPAPPSL